MIPTGRTSPARRAWTGRPPSSSSASREERTATHGPGRGPRLQCFAWLCLPQSFGSSMQARPAVIRMRYQYLILGRHISPKESDFLKLAPGVGR